MKRVADNLPGYTYGAVPTAPFSVAELEHLKATVGFTAETEQFLRLAGEVLADQTQQVVERWRSGIILGIPHLARHSRSPEGAALPDYLARSNLRFRQWILDTCLRPYDQDWLNYQHEIALRHTSEKKNQTDGVRSTPFVPLRDIIGFVAVMNETILPYLSAKGHPPEVVHRMHLAWCKSLQLQIALWSQAFTHPGSTSSQW